MHFFGINKLENLETIVSMTLLFQFLRVNHRVSWIKLSLLEIYSSNSYMLLNLLLFFSCLIALCQHKVISRLCQCRRHNWSQLSKLWITKSSIPLVQRQSSFNAKPSYHSWSHFKDFQFGTCWQWQLRLHSWNSRNHFGGYISFSSSR